MLGASFDSPDMVFEGPIDGSALQRAKAGIIRQLLCQYSDVAQWVECMAVLAALQLATPAFLEVGS